jgi:hypothetical protein
VSFEKATFKKKEKNESSLEGERRSSVAGVTALRVTIASRGWLALKTKAVLTAGIGW